MKNLRLALLFLACSLVSLSSARAEGEWLSDFSKAQATAKAEHKLLLLNFTGSDWCIWCLRLEAEIFSKPEFLDYAKKHLVLMTVDFPRAKQLSEEVRRQNAGLAAKFEVQGFPTVLMLDGDGKSVGLLGYMPGGPKAFIEELKKLPQS